MKEAGQKNQESVSSLSSSVWNRLKGTLAEVGKFGEFYSHL